MVRSDGDPLQVIPMKIASESPPPWGEAQAAKEVGDELKASKANYFTKGEVTIHQTLSDSGDNEHG
jgi:hypothetical protein